MFIPKSWIHWKFLCCQSVLWLNFQCALCCWVLFEKIFMLITTNKHLGESSIEKQGGTSQYSVFHYYLFSGYAGCFNQQPQGDYTKVWYVHDVITPSLDEVKWLEEGAIAEPPAWIADGSFYQAHMRQSLVNANDIFVSTYEEFNWPLVAPNRRTLLRRKLQLVSRLQKCRHKQPRSMAGCIMATRYAMVWSSPQYNTKVSASLNQTTQVAQLWTWFHITRVPEYVVGEGTLENWLTGFDLTPVSTGSLKLWEFYRDFNKNGTTYSLLFKAPANVLSQHGNNFTFNIGVSSYYHGYTFKTQQVIDVNMPATTEIKQQHQPT